MSSARGRRHRPCTPNDASHPGTADAPTCFIPHEDKAKDFVFQAGRPFFREAIRNAYCYEWFSLSLQADYNPTRFHLRNKGA